MEKILALLKVLYQALKSTSGKFNLDGVDFLKIFRDAFFVGVAAAATALLDAFKVADLGELKLVLIPVITLLVSAVHRWVRDNTKS